MPLERVSKGFKDVSASFLVSSLNYDLISLKNENAIARRANRAQGAVISQGIGEAAYETLVHI